MIGSHDSYTYLRARCPIVNLLKGTWRTQDKSLAEQWKAGVRFFDIRVFRDGNKWRTAHGIAEFGETAGTLAELAKDIVKLFPGCRFRIWMEKGTDADWKIFTAEADVLIKRYRWALVDVYRKDPWEEYYKCENYPTLVDLAFHDWDWKTAIRSVFRSVIRQWAKENNIVPTKEQISDRGTIYLMDFV